MIHIVLEPPATIKTVKSYTCVYCFIHFLLRGVEEVDKITLPLQTLIFRWETFRVPLLSIYKQNIHI